MPIYKAPVDDVLFLLNDVFQIGRYDNLPGFADASPDVIEAILAEAAKFCEQVLTPLNRVGDVEGCTRHDDGSVTTPKGFKEAFKQYAEGGWMGISAPAEFGGQGLPETLTVAVNEMMASANMAFAMYPGLTQGAIAALIQHGTPEQKATYLPPMIEGRWTGTMNLTEPHCGTDLGLLRTKAVKQADGSYRITGTKIFISAGEHDLAENIVHLVLARIEGAPAGIRGISLFVVPKFLVNADGSLGRAQRRRLRLDRREDGHPRQCHLRDELRRRHRLAGRRGEPRPQRHVHDDERGAARRRRAGARAVRGRLSERRGLRARTACRAARSAARNFPTRPADPIIVHPDVRRMLMSIRAFNEAARALVLWTALQGDVAHRSGDDKARAGGRRSHGPADAGDQRRAHRPGLRQYGAGAAGLRRPRLHRRARHGAVRARRPHRHDLRGRERHPGARSRRPQAAEGWRARAAGILQRGAGLHQGAAATTR